MRSEKVLFKDDYEKVIIRPRYTCGLIYVRPSQTFADLTDVTLADEVSYGLNTLGQLCLWQCFFKDDCEKLLFEHDFR